MSGHPKISPIKELKVGAWIFYLMDIYAYMYECMMNQSSLILEQIVLFIYNVQEKIQSHLRENET